MSLAKGVAATQYFLKGSITANEVSPAIRRDNFNLHSVFAAPDNLSGTAVNVTLQVCGREPATEADWVTLQAATPVPFHVTLPPGNYYALRVFRDNTVRPISVLVSSGDYAR